MVETLQNYVGGGWKKGSGEGVSLFDPVLADELVKVDATGLDLHAAFSFARRQGGGRCENSPTADAVSCSVP